MRLLVPSLLAAFVLALPAPAGAQPCPKKGPCVCDPPLVKVCGNYWDEYSHTTRRRCSCEYPSSSTPVPGEGPHAEIHKKNVPRVQPTPGPGPSSMGLQGTTGPRLIRRPLVTW
jgi:hypothetical protein